MQTKKKPARRDKQRKENIILALILALLFIFVIYMSGRAYTTPDTTVNYIVKPGDTLWEIAEMYCPNSHTGNTVFKIERLNHIDGYIVPGQVLTVPVEPMIMEATAYDCSIESCGKPIGHPSRGVTANGTDINHKLREEVMVIASNVFPLESVVKLTFEESHQQYDGIYTVADYGASAIDVFIGDDGGEEATAEAINFGRTKVRVEVIKDGQM